MSVVDVMFSVLIIMGGVLVLKYALSKMNMTINSVFGIKEKKEIYVENEIYIEIKRWEDFEILYSSQYQHDVKGKVILTKVDENLKNSKIYYIIDADYRTCGNFKGSLREFINYIRQKYNKDNKDRNQYLEVIKYIKSKINK